MIEINYKSIISLNLIHFIKNKVEKKFRSVAKFLFISVGPGLHISIHMLQ